MDSRSTGTHCWKLKVADEERVSRVAAVCGLPRLVARTLVARGVDTPQLVDEFCNPSLDRSWADPLIIPGMREVADEVWATLQRGERIAVFGDFDVDGITATALLTRGLRALGADAVPFVPTRYGEGYGLSPEALERVLGCEPALVITVDNGISAAKEALILARRGVRLVVTDHHEPSDLVPQGVPVTDPKLALEGPSRELAGVGVALKLVCELGRRAGEPDLWRELTDLAALGTVSDLMLLTEENRALVADGLARINGDPRPGFSALAALANASTATLSAEDLSYTLIPRINAAGRVGDPAIALDLFLTDDLDVVERTARQLEEINTQRRALEVELDGQARAQLAEVYHGERALVLAGEGWHEGVKGVVASRLVGTYGVPTILFTIKDGMAHGSGRSIGSINLFEAVSACSDLLERFGGHEMAVGLTLPEENLPAFRTRFLEQMDALPPHAFESVREVDASVLLGELTMEAIDAISCLEPFGQGMRAPLFVAEDVFMTDRGAVGRDGDHLRFSASDGLSSVPAIYFRCPDIENMLSCDQTTSVIFEAQVNEWRGHRNPKLLVRAIEMYDPTLPAGGGCIGSPLGADADTESGDDFHEDEGPGDSAVQTESMTDMASTTAEEQSLVDRILERADEYLVSDSYAGIAQALSFHTKVAGVTFEGRQEILSHLRAGEELQLVRDPLNRFDPHAVAVVAHAGQVGFLNRLLAEKLAPVIDGGVSYQACVDGVTGREIVSVPAVGDAACPVVTADSQIARNLGLNIIVSRSGGIADEVADAVSKATATRARLSQLSTLQLDDALREGLIGDRVLRPAQLETLGHLAQGESTLTVMATGRGKSLIFHLHAARIALRDHKASVFVYPLRALVTDQIDHLSDAFVAFGLDVRLLTGETSENERARVFEALADGSVNVVLTTPEFLDIHVRRFANTGRIGFLVVDEAHHIATSRAGHRPSYGHFPAIRAVLGNAVCLAVTATAGYDTTCAIDVALDTTAHVFDPSVRANLELADQRGARPRRSEMRDLYLASLVSHGEKTIAYVNSREGGVRITRMLRKRVPQLAQQISYYHAGLPKSDRLAVERAFREGEVTTLIATSAFGEGIDIPDVRNVVLYHMPFSDVEFNQMSGRAGRDGRPSTIHLLFSAEDATINERILNAGAPGREDLATLYRTLRQAADEGVIGLTGPTSTDVSDDLSSPSHATTPDASPSLPPLTNEDLVARCAKTKVRCGLDEHGVSSGLAVFAELGLITVRGRGPARRIALLRGPQRVDLSHSTRYLEGHSEVEEFSAFKEWVLASTSEDLLAHINRPILPFPSATETLG